LGRLPPPLRQDPGQESEPLILFQGAGVYQAMMMIMLTMIMIMMVMCTTCLSVCVEQFFF
jgi:hypothetical protein